MKAAIVIDAWKLPIFQKHLTGAGYAFEHGPKPEPEVNTLFVHYHSQRERDALELVVRAANAEAAQTGKPK